jgi:predicted porin
MKPFSLLARYLAPPVVLLMLAGHAQAQSSVTLYGIVDAGILYVHNSGGHANQLMLSPVDAGPRFGLKGQEDLGGGLSAIFVLENGFNIANGALMAGSNRIFGRQAYMGLSSQEFGTITLGRQYDPFVDQIQSFTGDWTFGPMSATPGDIDNYDASARFNNSVKWTSPNYRGLQVEGMYAFGGAAGAVGSGQSWAGSMLYQAGPAAFSGGWLHINNGNGALRGTSSADTLFNSPVNEGYASASSIDIAKAGARYVTDKIQLSAVYSFSTYTADGSSSFANAQHFHDVSVLAKYNLTPSLLVAADYNYLRAVGDASAKYHTFVIGAIYSLSKRTSMYAFASNVHVIGEQRNAAGQLVPAQAVTGSFDIASGASTQQLVAIGMTHSF